MLSSLFTLAGLRVGYTSLWAHLRIPTSNRRCLDLLATPHENRRQGRSFSGSPDIQELNFLKHNNYIVLS